MSRMDGIRSNMLRLLKDRHETHIESLCTGETDR